MSLQRHPDWPERLAAAIDARRDVPFAWGANDCCLFAADIVLAITGVDLAADLRGMRRAAAARYARQAGGVRALAASRLPEVAPALAGRGDVVCAVVGDREYLGVRITGSAWCAPGAHGLVFRPAGEVVAGFKV